ncbi:hypothetical protein [Halarcobacter ebronensis]|uniref:Uncharacterized protein n=1 Tax=Halarcobacter ebronensis TaxID=1462615 RepID=A0A4V1LZL4_9BACT|nr:hypothetical protein [Halarcobacter ebronensis]QKF83109.1 hypothetical protein AEBR_2653 [Halarcobacter ebronensis]RXK01395.1 hypothetical protein CRV07_15065 [Halarcobacter ebronensis]
MDISIINSNDVKGLDKYIGDNILIIDIKYKENLHFIQMSSETECFRGISSSRKGAIANTLKAIKKVYS